MHFLQVAIKVLENFLSAQSSIPWQTLRYLIGEVVYGGWVTDSWDRRCLNTLLYKFCNPEVLKDDFSFSTDEVRKGFIFLTLLIMFKDCTII